MEWIKNKNIIKVLNDVGQFKLQESEMSGLEIEFTGFLTDSLSIDMNLAFLDSEVTSDYEV